MAGPFKDRTSDLAPSTSENGGRARFCKKKKILFCEKKRSDKKDMKNESLRASTSIHLQGLFFMEKCEAIIFRNLPKVEN